MFQTDSTLQPQLFAFTPRDLVSENSDVWLYCDLFDSLNLRDFDLSYSRQGQSPKEPKLMLRTIFYALTHGVIGGRRLQDACRNDNRFIVLSGDTRPDRRTFDRFIVRHRKAIDGLFVQVVRLAKEMGMVSLGRVAVDGSKFRSPTGKTMKYNKMERACFHIRENLDRLSEDLSRAEKDDDEVDALHSEISTQEQRLALIEQAKARIEENNESLAKKASQKKLRLEKASIKLHDQDALRLGPSGKSPYGFNVQAAVDEKHQIIVGAEVHDNASDQTALQAMLDTIEAVCEDRPASLLADACYNSLSSSS